MPVYFFHLHEEIDVQDEEGASFADDDAARDFAILNVRDLAAHSVREGRLVLAHWIEVVEQGGRPVVMVRYSDAIRIDG